MLLKQVLSFLKSSWTTRMPMVVAVLVAMLFMAPANIAPPEAESKASELQTPALQGLARDLARLSLTPSTFTTVPALSPIAAPPEVVEAVEATGISSDSGSTNSTQPAPNATSNATSESGQDQSSNSTASENATTAPQAEDSSAQTQAAVQPGYLQVVCDALASMIRGGEINLAISDCPPAIPDLLGPCDPDLVPVSVDVPGYCGEPLPSTDLCQLLRNYLTGQGIPGFCGAPLPSTNACSYDVVDNANTPGLCQDPIPPTDPCYYWQEFFTGEEIPGWCGEPIPKPNPCSMVTTDGDGDCLPPAVVNVLVSELFRLAGEVAALDEAVATWQAECRSISTGHPPNDADSDAPIDAVATEDFGETTCLGGAAAQWGFEECGKTASNVGMEMKNSAHAECGRETIEATVQAYGGQIVGLADTGSSAAVLTFCTVVYLAGFCPSEGGVPAARPGGPGTPSNPLGLPLSTSHALESLQGSGDWQLSLAPDAGAVLATMDSEEIGSQYGEMVGFSLNFADQGHTTQDIGYSMMHGEISQEVPLWKTPAGQGQVIACAAMMALTYEIGKWGYAAAVASGGPTNPGGATIAGVAAAVFVASLGFTAWECAKAASVLADSGEWESCWAYDVWFGIPLSYEQVCSSADAATTTAGMAAIGTDDGDTTGSAGNRWRGTILSVLGGEVAAFNTSIDINAGGTIPGDYVTPQPEGWESNQEAWNGTHANGLSDAWTAHQAYHLVQGRGQAAMNLHVPLLEKLNADVHEVLVSLGTLPGVGDVYATLEGEGIFIGCKTACAESAFLTIRSPGTGTLTPGQGSVTIGFAGDQGQATILIAGALELSGFTLDVNTNAQIGQ